MKSSKYYKLHVKAFEILYTTTNNYSQIVERIAWDLDTSPKTIRNDLQDYCKKLKKRLNILSDKKHNHTRPNNLKYHKR